MRLYLSSFRLGNRSDALLALLGDGRQTALIANAVDFLDVDARSESVRAEIERLKSIGLAPTELDLRRYFSRDSELRSALLEYDLIWVRGGNAFVLRRALKQSGADNIIAGLLERDEIVYGGYSAAIDMLGPTLRGTELVDDPTVVPGGYDPPIVWRGLDILPYCVVPHYKSDHPESAKADDSVQYMIDNHMLFKVLRDGQVIVVSGEEEIILD
jgi:dipeptidase E